MSETSRKRSRKNKLVPRECFNDYEEVELSNRSTLKVEDIQITDVRSEAPPLNGMMLVFEQNGGYNIFNSNNILEPPVPASLDAELVKEETKVRESTSILMQAAKEISPPVKFNIKVEVEEYDDDDALVIDEGDHNYCAIDESEASAANDTGAVNQMQAKDMQSPATQNQPVINTINNIEKKGKKTKPVITKQQRRKKCIVHVISRPQIIAAADDILKKSLHSIDKIYATEVKNVLGYILTKQPPAHPVEQILQTTLFSWVTGRWQLSPLFYKCYKCTMAWWHYYEFKEHMKTHTEALKVSLEEISHEECNIVAYCEANPNKQAITILDACWKCGRPCQDHQLQPAVVERHYECAACARRFSSCISWRTHLNKCPKLLLQSREAYRCTICPNLYLTSIELDVHYLLSHDVRSDLVSSVPTKKCSDCREDYVVQKFHVCPVGLRAYQCNFCFRKFQNKLQLEMHQTIGNKSKMCEICNRLIQMDCFKLQHTLLHGSGGLDRFKFVFKCLLCAESADGKMTVLLSKTSLGTHLIDFHNERGLWSYMVKVLSDPLFIPSSCLKNTEVDNRQVLAQPMSMNLTHMYTSISTETPTIEAEAIIPVGHIKIEFGETPSYDVIRLAGSSDATQLPTSSDVTQLQTSTDVAKATINTDAAKLAENTDAANSATNTDVAKSATNTDAAKSAGNTDILKPVAGTDIAKAGDDKGVAKATVNTDVAKTVVSTGVAKSTGSTGVVKSTESTGVAKSTVSTGIAKTVPSTSVAKLTENTDIPTTVVSSSVAKLAGSISVAKSTGNPGVAKSTGSTGVAKSTGSTSVAKSTGSTGVANSTGSTSVAKSTGNTGIATSTGSTVVAKSTGNTGIATSTGSTGVAKSTTSTGVAKSTENTGVAKSTENTGIAKSTGTTGIAKTVESTGVTKSAESTSISKSARSTNVTSSAASSDIPWLAVTIKDEPMDDYPMDDYPMDVDEHTEMLSNIKEEPREEYTFDFDQSTGAIIAERADEEHIKVEPDIYAVPLPTPMYIAMPEVSKRGRPRLYTCRCGYSASNKVMREHIENCCAPTRTGPDANEFNCTKCNTAFPCLRSYACHIPSHGYDAPTCPKCSESFERAVELVPHLKKHLTQGFMRVRNLDRTAVPKYRCLVCKVDVFMGLLFNHWETHLYGETEAEAPVVASEPEDKEDKEGALSPEVLASVLERLQTTTRDRSPRYHRTCPVCSREFQRYTDSKRHMIEHLLMDAFSSKSSHRCLRCQLCREGFIKQDHYRKHMRDHAALPIFQCELCDKCFSDSSNFTKHKKTHNLEVVICDICKAKFQAKKSLEKHLASHGSAVTCSICMKVFYSTSKYNKHVRMQHEAHANRFGCKQCSHRFNCLKEKWDHMWTKHGERKFQADCKLCPEKFRNLSRLRLHMREAHNIKVKTSGGSSRSKGRQVKYLSIPGNANVQALRQVRALQKKLAPPPSAETLVVFE